jgi:hypothetical protein
LNIASAIVENAGVFSSFIENGYFWNLNPKSYETEKPVTHCTVCSADGCLQ